MKTLGAIAGRGLAALVVLLACRMEALAGAVKVADGCFWDREGHRVILRGLNVANASKVKPYLPWQGPEHFAKMRQWGCNCIRFLVLWAGVEPQPGRYDDAYLDALRQRLDWAAEAGLYVILDMHQDVFGEKYGFDGAPAWACLDNGVQFSRDDTHLWGANYFDPAVMTAFDSFWANAPAPDGLGVQEHFVRAWRYVVEKLGSHPAVIGYDLLNEPFYGNILREPQTVAAFVKISAILPLGSNPLELFSPTRSARMQAFMADPGKLFRALDCADGVFRRFEEDKLMPFYERLTAALAELTPGAIFFLEPHIFASAGANSFLTRPLAGGRDITVAYAPHYYDPGCTPAIPYDGNPARAAEAFRRMAATALRLRAPVLLGEFGDAESPRETSYQYVRDQLLLLRQMGFSFCYWEYGPDLESRPCFPALLEAFKGD